MSYTDDLILNSIKKSREGIDGEPDALTKAMNKAGLVQKDVQVRGKNGQMFTRKQWVKAGEEQSPQKPAGKSDEDKVQYKLDKTNSGKVGAVWIIKPDDGKEAATVVSKAPDSYTRSFDVTVENKTFTIYTTGNTSVAVQKLNNKQNDVMQTWKDKVDAGNFTDDVKKELKYGIDTKASALVKKGKEYKTAKTWDEADYAKKQGWEVVGSITDIINAGKLPDSSGSDSTKNSKNPSNMSDDELDSAIKSKAKEISEILKDGNPTGSLREKYDKLVEESKILQQEQTKRLTGSSKSNQNQQDIDFGNRDKQSLLALLQSGKSREDIMSAAEKQGITWKKSDHAGVNWMRCSMAITGTTTKGSKKEDVTQQKKPKESASKTNDTDTSKDNSSVIGKDYHSLTTDKEAETPAGEAHNMMVGALKSRGMLPKTGQIKPDSAAINTVAKELRRRQMSLAIKATQKDEETRALQVAKELDKIAGYSSPFGFDDIEVVLKNCMVDDSCTQDERTYALSKLLGKDYVPYPGAGSVRTATDTVDGTVSASIVPKLGGYYDATFTYADGSSRSETYDSISVVKAAADKFIKNEVDFVERMNNSTMSEIEKGNTYSFAKMFAKKYPAETAEIGLDPQNNYRALIEYNEEDKVFTVWHKNGDKDFFDNKMNYLGRKLY